MIKLEDRVTKLERDMEEVRRDVDTTRTLSSGAHQDVGDVRAELRAHIKSLEALRENQLEMRTEMRDEFGRAWAEFAAVHSKMDAGFTEMREGFTKIGLGMAAITAKLNIAIGRDDTGD